MIHPDAIKEFFNRPTDSHIWVKDLSERKLDEALADLGFRSPRKDKPLKVHQKACMLLALAYAYFAFWLDMGTGKTRLMLEWFLYKWEHGEAGTMLVLVPSEQAVYGWEKQIREWQIDIPYIALGNSPTDDKWNMLAEFDQGIILMTYPGLQWLLSRKMKGKKGKVVMKPNPGKLKKFAARIDALVMDESTKLGNQGSLIFRICRAISKVAEYRYALAGRPFGRDPTLIWSQQWLVDHGETLGDTLGLFRAAFFNEKPGSFGGFEYTFDKRMEPELATMMQHRSLTYASSECQTLPRVTTIIEAVPLPPDMEAYYEEMKKELIRARGNYREMENIFLRMRQLSSGFLGFKDDETGARIQMEFPVKPKLERMLELIDEVPHDRKFVIFNCFVRSGRLISEKLTDAKLKHGRLWGGSKNSKDILDRFDNDPKMRGLVVATQLGSMSLNLQVSNYVFVYESPVPVIEREQMEKRCFREGQEWPGFLYDMVSRGTMDYKILKFHKEGADLFKALLRDPYGIVDDAKD